MVLYKILILNSASASLGDDSCLGTLNLKLINYNRMEVFSKNLFDSSKNPGINSHDRFLFMWELKIGFQFGSHMSLCQSVPNVRIGWQFEIHRTLVCTQWHYKFCQHVNLLMNIKWTNAFVLCAFVITWSLGGVKIINHCGMWWFHLEDHSILITREHHIHILCWEK